MAAVDNARQRVVAGAVAVNARQRAVATVNVRQQAAAHARTAEVNGRPGSAAPNHATAMAAVEGRRAALHPRPGRQRGAKPGGLHSKANHSNRSLPSRIASLASLSVSRRWFEGSVTGPLTLRQQ